MGTPPIRSVSDVQGLTGALAGKLSAWLWSKVSTTDIAASRAGAPLTIPTFDGSGQAMHPSVVHAPAGWNGHTYWMAMTPYPNADTTKECPSILCSDDGYSWSAPVGLTNPIIPYDGIAPWSDPCLFLTPDGTTLVCLYRNNFGTKTLWAQTSTDGVAWSAKQAVSREASATDDTTAPSVLWDGAQWLMFSVDLGPTPNRVVRRTAASYLGPWSAPVTVTGLGSEDFWHADVNRLQDGTLHMFITEATTYTLIFASSTDGGVSWTQSASPIIGALPAQASASWDRWIYKVAALPIQNPDGSRWYRMWYSASSNGTTFATGYTEVSYRRGGLWNRGRLSILSGRTEGGIDVSAPDAATPAMVARAAASQTADIQRWIVQENPLYTTLINSSGGVRVRQYSGSAASASGVGIWGDSEAQNSLTVASNAGNLKVGATPSVGNGVGVIAVKNATTIPNANPASGGVLYVEAGALKYRGSSGTVTVLAPA